jgi:hypothetical protein
MKERIAALISYIDKEWETVNGIVKELTVSAKRLNKKSKQDKIVYTAYLLHNLYCAFEDLFKTIAKTFENNIDDPSQYHMELLKRMKMPVYKIRPEFLSDENFITLNELRKFRHLFRHAYEYELDGEKVISLTRKYLTKAKNIENDKNIFKKFLLEAIEK